MYSQGQPSDLAQEKDRYRYVHVLALTLDLGSNCVLYLGGSFLTDSSHLPAAPGGPDIAQRKRVTAGSLGS